MKIQARTVRPACWLASSYLLLTAFLLPVAAPAQDGDAPATSTRASASEPFEEEIVVTARKREENVQSVPLAITTFDQVAIEERSLVDLSDLADFTPNVDISSTGGFGDQSSEATVFIRGVGQIDTAIFSDPAVGIYVDGVYLARAQGAILDLLDLERVEVLRGPQGTLFGKNTTGGAISLITKKPGSAFQGRLGGTVGDYDRLDGVGSVSGALTEDLLASLVVQSTQREGFARSLASGQRFNDDDREAARLGLRWLPSASVVVDWSGDFTREREAGSLQSLLSLADTPLLDFLNRSLAAGGLPPYDARWITGDLSRSFGTIPSFYDGDVWGSALTVSWTGADLGVQSITALRGLEFDTRGDGDGSPVSVAQRTAHDEQQQFSQELQVFGSSSGDRLTWLAGALYFRETPEEQANNRIFGDLFPALEAAPGPVVAPPGVPAFLCTPVQVPGVPCFGGAGNPLNLAFFTGNGGFQELDLETSSIAFFTEGTWAATDRLSLTAGLRYTRDEKEFRYQNTNPFGVVDADLFNQGDWDAWTPRFSLAFQARPDLLLYTTVSRGFKSGGFNGRPQQRQVLDPFDPERVWTYEAGVKSDWLERRLRANAALFYSDYQDIQFAASLDVGGQPVFVTQNAGTARIQGAELELTAQPLPRLLLTAAAGYLDNELTDLDPGVPPGLREGGRLPKTPEWTFSTSAQYSFSLGTRGTLIARADYSYRDDVFNDIANTPGIAQEAFGLLHARLLYAPPSDRWDVALFGTNLTDEQYLEHGFFASAFGPRLGLPGRPREWGLTAQVRF